MMMKRLQATSMIDEELAKKFKAENGWTNIE